MFSPEYISEKIASAGVLPVINVPSESLAAPLAKALIDGGMAALEITLRSDCSLAAIRSIKAAYPEFIVGAGTVLTPSDADAAIDAGADFIVSPGLDPELVVHCQSRGKLIVPGCATPTEIQFATVKCGLTVLKFFPAELSGGVDAIKLLSGPFPTVRFVPTGGITMDNLASYLCCDKVLACGGSFMAKAEEVKNGKFDEISTACRRALDIAASARG